MDPLSLGGYASHLKVSKGDISLSNSKDLSQNIATDVARIQGLSENIPNSKKRIYLLRHYPEDIRTGGYYSYFEDLPEHLQANYDGIFKSSGNILLIYDGTNDASRVSVTAKNLIEKYQIGERQVINDVSLLGSYNPTEHKLERKIRTFNEFYELAQIIIDYNVNTFDTIIIIANRTYLQPFDLFSGGKKDMNVKALEENGYQFRDFSEELLPIIPEDCRLVILPELYGSYCNLFIEISCTNSQSLQLKIENLFNDNNNLYAEYLPNHLLKRFCLANLIRLNTYTPLESYYLSGTCISLSQEEKELILKNISDQLGIKKDSSMSAFTHKNRSYPLLHIFERLFLTRPEFWEDDRSLIVEYLGIQTYELLIDRRKRLREVTQFSEENTNNILKYSVDGETQSGNLLNRKLFLYSRKPESEIKRLQSMSDGTILKEDEYFKMESTIKSILENPSLPRVILGHVGSGKSIELVRMRNEVVGSQIFEDYCSLLYVAKNFSCIGDFSIIQNGIKTFQEVFPEKRIILFFDGVDELGMDFRNQFLEHLQSLHSDTVRVIMTSRYFGFDPFVNTDFQPIQFCPLSSSDIDSFLISRLKSNGVTEDDLGQKLQNIHIFLSGSILHHELKNTPLILYFLTYLCAEDSLKDIHNRASLYNKIIVLLLLEHQDFKVRSNSQRWTIEILLDTLSYCAFKTSDNKKIKAEDIEKYLGERLKNNLRIGNKDVIIRSMIDKIFLLYRKEGGEYSFILKSFEEYFLARYFVHQHKESEKSDHSNNGEFSMLEACYSGPKDWVNWIKLHPIIIFYAETLINEGDYDQLAYFLSENGLGKEDDIFGVNFFIGLEILYGLPEKVISLSSIRVIFEKYTMKIDQWGIEDVILRFEAIMQLIQNSGYKDTHLSDRVLELLIQNNLVRYIYSLGTPASIKYFTDQIEVLSKKKVDVSYSKTKASEIASRLEAERLKREPVIGVKYLRENQFGSPFSNSTSTSTNNKPNQPSEEHADSSRQTEQPSSKIQKAIDAADEHEKSGRIQEAKEIYKEIISSYDEYGILKAREFGARWVNQGVIKEMFILYKFFIQSGNEGGVIDAIEYAKILANVGYLREVGILYHEFARSRNQMAINSLLDYATELVKQEQFPRAAYIFIYLVEYGTDKHIQSSIDFMEIIRVRKITKLRLSRNLFAIIRTGKRIAINYALECAERLMKEGSFIESLEIYSNLYKSNIYISQKTPRPF